MKYFYCIKRGCGWGIWILIVALLISISGCSGLKDTQESTSAVLRPANGTFSTLGSILPCIKVGDRIFYWRGLAENTDQGEIADWRESETTHIMTVRPTGFTHTAELKNVGLTEPKADYEMAADFEATGEIFENPSCPEVVYVQVKSEHMDGLYVRFTTDLLGESDRIAYKNQLYQILWDYVDTLPPAFELVGQLKPVGCDNLPQDDFETNSRFGFGNIYVSQDDPSRIFLDCELASYEGAKRYYECPVVQGTESLGEGDQH